MQKARIVRTVVSSLSAAALVALSIALAGCPGTLTDEEKAILKGGGACPDMPTFLAQKCGTAGCHVPGTAPAGSLDLASPDVEGRLVSVAGTATCNGTVLANPIDPTGSLIYEKLLDPPPCGLKMPLGGSLTEFEIGCVKSWVEGLDPNAGTGGPGGAGGSGGGGGSGGSGGQL